MTPSRLPRFKRDKNVHPIQITDRDRAILSAVHEHRFLRSSHILTYVAGSSQQLLRRLHLLYHHGFLERPRAQLDYYHQGGSRPIIYGLGQKGAQLLARERGVPLDAIEWGEKNRSVGTIYLEHALLVSDVMVAIEVACKQHGIRFLKRTELSPAANRDQTNPFRWKVNLNNSMALGVIPDNVFALDCAHTNGKSERAYFFLEADRGTMPVLRQNLLQTSMYRKFLAYEATWSQSIHRARFGFHRFRVLVVTESSDRVNSLVEACSKLERGRGLFLFSEVESVKKLGPLSAIWKCAYQVAPTRFWQ